MDSGVWVSFGACFFDDSGASELGSGAGSTAWVVGDADFSALRLGVSAGGRETGLAGETEAGSAHRLAWSPGRDAGAWVDAALSALPGLDADCGLLGVSTLVDTSFAGIVDSSGSSSRGIICQSKPLALRDLVTFL